MTTYISESSLLPSFNFVLFSCQMQMTNRSSFSIWFLFKEIACKWALHSTWHFFQLDIWVPSAHLLLHRIYLRRCIAAPFCGSFVEIKCKQRIPKKSEFLVLQKNRAHFLNKYNVTNHADDSKGFLQQHPAALWNKLETFVPSYNHPPPLLKESISAAYRCCIGLFLTVYTGCEWAAV